MKKTSSSQSQYLSALIEKRCEIYSLIAQYLLEIEETMENQQLEEFWKIFEKIRKVIRTSLAFLTEQIYAELEQLEALVLPHRHQPSNIDFSQVKTRLSILHIQFSRALKNPEIKDIEEILALPDDIRREVMESEERLARQKKEEELRKQAQKLADEAEVMVQEKKWKKAIKNYKKAIQLSPHQAVFHNDLGVVYSMQGMNDLSRESYQNAVKLNVEYPEQRTTQWVRTYFNLSKLSKKMGDELWRPNQTRLPLAHLKEEHLNQTDEYYREVIANLEEYIKLSPQGDRVTLAREMIQDMSVQLEEIADCRERLKKIR